jgi:hypothetical protein
MTALTLAAPRSIEIEQQMKALVDAVRGAGETRFHSDSFAWDSASTVSELAFLSVVACGNTSNPETSSLYVAKELGQLSEIEKHVSAVLLIILAELHLWDDDGILHSHELHNALSCFAAEETQHANAFYRYARTLHPQVSWPKHLNFAKRIALFQSNDHPWVKLSALLCSAYVGESVITVFENKLRLLDPSTAHFITQLITSHGCDEQRHILVDHFVFDFIVPQLSVTDRQRVMELVSAITELNLQMADQYLAATSAHATAHGLGDISTVPAYLTQTALTMSIGAALFKTGRPRPIDNQIDSHLAELLTEFSGQRFVHQNPDTEHSSTTTPPTSIVFATSTMKGMK